MLVGRFVILALLWHMAVWENVAPALAPVPSDSTPSAASTPDRDQLPSDDAEMQIPLDEDDDLVSVSASIDAICCAPALPPLFLPLTRSPYGDPVLFLSHSSALLYSLKRLRI